MSVKAHRRENLRLLAKALGGVAELADFLGKSPSQISHLVGDYINKNIGDRLAAEIEKAFAKPAGWLDGDYSGREAEVIATAIPPVFCYRVPFLNKQEVIDWILYPSQRSLNRLDYQYLYTSAAVSPAAYAYQVRTDCMEAGKSISFSKGTIVVVDPAVPMRNRAFILIRVDHELGPMLRQVVHANSTVFLRPLNERYPTIEFKQHFLYCGMIKQSMLINPQW